MPEFLFWLPGPKGQYSPAMDRPPVGELRSSAQAAAVSRAVPESVAPQAHNP